MESVCSDGGIRLYDSMECQVKEYHVNTSVCMCTHTHTHTHTDIQDKVSIYLYLIKVMLVVSNCF